jgi:3-deoxy-D-manno-octulosonate 8-phosphate phosphatase (KDO 8-P phosphatase)
VRCLLLDVDGVLTDGKIHIGPNGFEAKTFDIRDGSGIKLAQMAGLTVGFVSARPSKATTKRAQELAVRWVVQKPRDKGLLVQEIQHQAGFSPEQSCFVGDDLLDLPALRAVGFPVAVSDAAPEVKAAARYVTHAKGGDGAVREVVELIVKTQGLWKKTLQQYVERSSLSQP